jgi:hypothetical protein
VARTTNAQSDTLGPIINRKSFAVVHIEMGPAVAAASSTKMLDSISAA